MKVVIVHDFANAELGAGATRCALDTALALKAQGTDVTFFAAAGDPDADLTRAGVPVIGLGQSDIRRNASRAKAMMQGLWNADAADALGRVIAGADLANTIFHVHTWAKALSPSVLPVLTGPGVNSVFHLHEYFAACPNGGFFVYPSLSICRRKPLGLDCLTTQCDSRSGAVKAWRIGRHAMMRLRGHYPDRASNFIMLSETQRAALAPYLPHSARVTLMRNPIAVERQERLARTGEARYLFVGRVSKEKGLGLLIDGFADRQDQLVVIGDGPDMDWLKAALPGAEYRGWQSKQQVQQAMRATRALIFPSLWYEGMPMVVLEALACGAPVVLTRCSSAVEVVADGETGIVFDESAKGALSRAVARLDEEGVAERMSACAYARYWEHPCDIDRFATEALALYRRMLGEAPVPA
jgi:glycosyltransferase involved in cell wall biosynthesis